MDRDQLVNMPAWDKVMEYWTKMTSPPIFTVDENDVSSWLLKQITVIKTILD